MISTINGKKEVRLLIYQIKLSVTSSEYEADLKKTCKKFMAKPIIHVSSYVPYGTRPWEWQRDLYSQCTSQH